MVPDQHLRASSIIGTLPNRFRIWFISKSSYLKNTVAHLTFTGGFESYQPVSEHYAVATDPDLHSQVLMYWIYQRHATVHLSRRARPASEHVMSLSARRISADTEHVMERPKYQTNDTASLRMRMETDRITAHVHGDWLHHCACPNSNVFC